MILPDSSVWIDHLVRPSARLTQLLEDEQVVGHALVTAEVMLGSLARRDYTARKLDDLDQLVLASVEQTRWLIERRQLWSVGIGYVDANLLASTLRTPGTLLMHLKWTSRPHGSSQFVK